MEDDNIALSATVIELENTLEFLQKLVAESYNPYNSNRPLVLEALKQRSQPINKVDNSININIKR